ncbi:hypothetical protein [Nocardioides zeicaulis]|uniref:Nucleotidyltransferase domain-containing protein n=1 Tax=Nocardioides zeicaulis TaxID=1776857 RepID=A0ABV6DWE9_9ACTN
MLVQGIDERRLARERNGADFVVFIYTGGDAPQTSWAVDSLLITEAVMSEVLQWLTDNLPAGSCWSLGLVHGPAQPSEDTDVDVAWIVGSDVLNISPSDRSRDQQLIAQEMLARRDRVVLL